MQSICNNTGKAKRLSREEAVADKRFYKRATVVHCPFCGAFHAAEVKSAKGEQSEAAL